MKREEIVEHLIEDMAWANSRRLQIDSNAFDPQEILDRFRLMLTRKLAEMMDDEFPYDRENQWNFIHTNWSEYIKGFGITQSWEDFKKTDAYKEQTCKV